MHAFHDTIEWFKKHPLAIILIVGVVILVIVLASSGGSSSSTAAGAAAVDPNAGAEIAAQSNENLASIQAGAQEYQVGAQLEATNNQTSAQVAIATLTQQLDLYQTEQESVVSLAQNKSQENEALSALTTQENLASISATTTQAQIQATTDQAAITANTYEYLANLQEEGTLASYQTEEDISNINAAQNVAVAQFNSLGNVVQAASGTKSSVVYDLPSGGQVTYINSGPAKTSANDNSSFLGGLVGGLLSIF